MRGTDPEDVVDEQSTQQDTAGAHVVQVKQLHSIQSERQPEQIIGHPVLSQTHTVIWLNRYIRFSQINIRLVSVCVYLFQDVPHSHHAADSQTNQVLSVKLVVHNF